MGDPTEGHILGPQDVHQMSERPAGEAGRSYFPQKWNMVPSKPTSVEWGMPSMWGNGSRNGMALPVHLH